MSTHARTAVLFLVAAGTLAGAATAHAGGKGFTGGSPAGGAGRSMRSIPQGGGASLRNVFQGGQSISTTAQPKIFKQPTTAATLNKFPTLDPNITKTLGSGAAAGTLNGAVIRPRLENLNVDA